MSSRGFFGIGIEHTKTETNVGTLWRTANILGASFIFTIGRRYKRQSSDTLESWRHIPLYHHDTFEDFYKTIPYDCVLVGVEMDERSKTIKEYKHPARAIYLLGAEDHGLTEKALTHCHHLVVLPGERSMNVAVAGSIVLFDRHSKITS
jgi:tRNA G18 (ribose-2'-O)-methylase SpoU